MVNILLKRLLQFIYFILFSSSLYQLKAQCNGEQDSLELIKFYDNFNGDNWINKWKLNDPKNTWPGLRIDPNGCVDSISLQSNNLVGELYDFNFPNLIYLDLSSNNIYGRVPNLLKIPQLIELYLSNDSIIGSIPDFSNLQRLNVLDLSNNYLSDTIPDFSNLRRLSKLNLSYNNLIGLVPDFSKFPPTFRSLELSGNKLSGKIPDFSKLPQLRFLRLDDNKLNDPIPDFSKVPDLTWLELSHNKFNDQIRDFSNLPKLKYLILSHNNFNDTIPNFSNIDNLVYIDLSYNKLNGKIPTFSHFNLLETIDFSNNKLIGQIPDFVNLSDLMRLNLRNNNLSGTPLIASGQILDRFHIDYNKFTFSNLSPLRPAKIFTYSPQDFFFVDTVFNVLKNKSLSIDLVIDENLTTNTYVWRNNNNTSWRPHMINQINSNKLIFPSIENSDVGRYTVNITNSDFPSLRLTGRNISIRVCDTPKDSTQLVNLFDSTDGFNWINKKNWLDPNKPISSWYGITINSQGCVQKIDLNNNNLTGRIPPMNLNTLDTLILNGNNLSGSIPELVTPFIKLIDLNTNQLTGAFPTILHDWMDLEGLDISNNKLIGPIPPDLGDLCNLRQLNLDSNQINGEIPVELAKLHQLELGNVDFKNNVIDVFDDKIIFLCPFGDSIMLNNPGYSQFRLICKNECQGTDWNVQDSIPWLLDSLYELKCNKDSLCFRVSSIAGFVKVRNVLLIFTQTKCCDSLCNNLKIETKFYHCGGGKLESVICDSGLCKTSFGALSIEDYHNLKYDIRWQCGDSIQFFSKTSDPDRKQKFQEDKGIICFPNPVYGEEMNCKIPNQEQVKFIRLVSIDGRNYSDLSWNTSDNEMIRLSIPYINSGMYVLEILTQKQRYFTRLIVESNH